MTSFLVSLLATELALLIALAGCPFTVSQKVVKPFLTIVFKAFQKYQVKLDQIDPLEMVSKLPITDKTISRRVERMSRFLEDDLIKEIKSSPIGFAIQLDESTDVTNVARLIAFVR